MKKTTLTLIASLLTCSTLFSQATLADDRDDGHRMPVPHQNNDHRPDNRGPDQNHDRDNARHDDRNRHDNDKNHRPDHAARADRDHFAWHGHEFRRGHAIPSEYRGDRYRVADWHERGLREPPRGYHWADIDGNYVLIAAATGVITALVLNSAMN